MSKKRVMRKASSQTKKPAASANKRYTVSYLIWLSPVEDAELIADIESTYGRSKSERGRNYLRARSGKDYSLLRNGKHGE